MLDKEHLKRKKLAICFSGGLDSFVAYWYAHLEIGIPLHEIALIHFNIGQPYMEKEKKVIDTLLLPVTEFNLDLIRPDLHNVPNEKNYIIPARNLIFAAIASGFAKRIWIMGMKYENHYLMYDKNDMFYHTATVACTQALGEYTVIESPFIDKTKTDIISWAKTNGIQGMELTTSCYHPDKLRCGECSLCFKRFIAMASCGISEEYDTNPLQSKEAKTLISEYKKAWKKKDFSHYAKERIEETFLVLRRLQPSLL